MTASTPTSIKVGEEFWTKNVIGRLLADTLRKFNDLPPDCAPGILQDALDTGTEITIKLPGLPSYKVLDGWHLIVKIFKPVPNDSETRLLYDGEPFITTTEFGDSGDCVRYGDESVYYRTMDLPLELAEFARLAECNGPEEPDEEKMNDEVMTEERTESVRRLEEELRPPVPANTIGEHIPENPVEVPKYVQMVHHEEPVVHPPVPKKPVEKKQEPATPGKTDGGFAGKLYRAAAMAVVKFGERECTAASGEEIFSMTNSQLMRELMPLVISACDSYLAGSEAGQGAIRIPGQPGWVFLRITDDSVKISLVPVEVEEQI